MHNEPGDGDLLRSMLNGSEEAFTMLYRRYHSGIYRFARQMTGETGLAEEVLQEVFLTLMRRGRSFDPRRGSLSAWLYGIARNCVHRCLEQERPYVALEAGAGEVNSAEISPGSASVPGASHLESRETVDQVRRAVLALPANYREVVVLCELQELAYAEAAQILSCPVGTVRSRLHRARELLASRLQRLRESAADCVAGQCPR